MLLLISLLETATEHSNLEIQFEILYCIINTIVVQSLMVKFYIELLCLYIAYNKVTALFRSLFNRYRFLDSLC